MSQRGSVDRRADEKADGKAARSMTALLSFATFLLLAFAGLAALGTWQLERRVWKLDLIARVDARVHAPPISAPGPGDWFGVTAKTDEYRHVRLSGRFLPGHTTLVQALTARGSGYWVLAPLERRDGSRVLINRGFVAQEERDRAAQGMNLPAGEVVVTGLMRMTEPEGTFLRRNDPPAGRWYSRDVQAMAVAQGLADVAPYFVDADAGPAPPSAEHEASVTPIGGLTVISFSNNHLVYALTWYGLALMVLYAGWRLVSDERMLRAGRDPRGERNRRNEAVDQNGDVRASPTHDV